MGGNRPPGTKKKTWGGGTVRQFKKTGHHRKKHKSNYWTPRWGEGARKERRQPHHSDRQKEDSSARSANRGENHDAR